MDFTPVVVGAAMVTTAVSFLKLLRGKLYGDALTMIVVVAVGILAAFLLRASDFAAGIDVGGLKLSNLNAASTSLFGYALGSSASVIQRFIKRPDNDPKLFDNPTPG